MENFYNRSETQDKPRDILDALNQERMRIFYAENMDYDERRYGLLEVDERRTSLIAEDEALYSEYVSDRPSSQMEEAFNTATKNFLKDTFLKEHFVIHVGTEITLCGSTKELGIVTRATITEKLMLNDENSIQRYSLRITEPTIYDEHGSVEHAAAVYLDVAKEEVRVVVSPEGVDRENPQKLLQERKYHARLEQVAMLVLGELFAKTEYTPVATTDKNVSATGLYRQEGPTELHNESKSNIGWRRRVFTKEDTNRILTEVADLVSSWSASERKILEMAGGGVIRMRLLKRDSIDEFYDDLTEDSPIPSTDSVAIKEKIEHALNFENSEAVVAFCLGTWVPPEYRNRPPGTSPDPHLRRLKEKFINSKGGIEVERPHDFAIILPKYISGEAREIQRKIRNGEPLIQEQVALLETLIKGKLPQQVITGKGIILKDGTFDQRYFPGSSNQEIQHTYKKKTSRFPNQREEGNASSS